MEPLANKIRPLSLEDYVGQSHLVGEGKPLRRAIEQKHLFSFLLWGPPGVGKTTLARIYANAINAEYFELSAVSAGKDDIRKIISNDETSILNQRPKILFLDEIHRFNKAQQDFLLPYVESGKLYLIGATTENPSFEVIPALLSRCRVFVLNELGEEEMGKIIDSAINQPLLASPLPARNATHIVAGGEKGRKDQVSPSFPKEEKQWLIQMANGDARQALTIIDNCISLYNEITLENLKNTLQSKTLRYDKAGEEHYNTISAFIKSMRASDPDSAVYYLARMVEAGEDPKFIARRMVIFASEDIGLAQPTALVVANEVFKTCEVIGYPECAINLAHGAIYLANCKKNRSVYNALRSAQVDIKKYGNLPIPLKLRNASTKLMKNLDYGKDYEMYPENESLLPDELTNQKYLL
jgi:putative ATPase